MAEKKYTPGQVDGRWTDEMKVDFKQWLRENTDILDVPKKRIQEYLNTGK